MNVQIEAAPLEVKAQGEANEYCLMRGGNWFANFRMNGELHIQKQEAYARLFAAAPDLLAACKYTLEQQEEAGFWHDDDVQALRNAIAKAEGVQS